VPPDYIRIESGFLTEESDWHFLLNVDPFESILQSISSTFYAQFFCTNSHFGSFFYLHVTRENDAQHFTLRRKNAETTVGTKNLRVKCWWNWHLEFVERNEIIAIQISFDHHSFSNWLDLNCYILYHDFNI